MLVVLFALAATLVSASPGDEDAALAGDAAQRPEAVIPLLNPPNGYPIQWAVKFVCGYVPPASGEGEPPVVPGHYATAINIDNPYETTKYTARRVHLHYNPGEPFPPVTPSKQSAITRWRVLEIDCLEIWSMIGVAPGTFVKGMVHIGSTDVLPIAAVYTSQTDLSTADPPDTAAGKSIDVEYVDPFRSSAG